MVNGAAFLSFSRHVCNLAMVFRDGGNVAPTIIVDMHSYVKC